MASVAALGRAAIISTILASGGGGTYTRMHNHSFDGGNNTMRSTSLRVPCNEKLSKTKGNFYRQPNLQRVRPSNASCEVRRRQFAQKMFWYGDALSNEDDTRDANSLSPEPHVVRRHSSAEVYYKKSQPASILKRNDSEAGTSDGNSVNVSPVGSLCSPTRQTAKKSTHFRENVEVIYYDQRDRPTSCGTRDQEKLKDERDASPRLTEAVVKVECPLHGNSCCHDNDTMDNGIGDTQGNFLTRPIFHSKTIEIVKGEDTEFRWKIYVPVGGEFIRNKTSVKALSGGRKIILMAYKSGQTDDGECYLHQFIEQLYLPHAIDAYSVKATMDKEGNLKINAPIQNDTIVSTSS